MRSCWIAVFLVASAGLDNARAQDRQVGAKVGATIASQSYEDVQEGVGYGKRVYASGGGFLVQPLAGPLSLQVEGLIVSKGSEMKTHDTFNTTYTLMLYYVEVPTMARIGVTHSSAHSVYLIAGPASGWRTEAKLRTATGSPIRSGVDEDVKSDVNLYEFSVIVGGGVDIQKHIVIDARYSWGLTPVNHDAPAGHEVYNRALTVLAGFRY
jgi:hypothetical protein